MQDIQIFFQIFQKLSITSSKYVEIRFKIKILRRIVKEELHQSQSKLDNPFLDSVKEKVIMHIDFDCFFATASCLLRPDLDINKHPIAVTHGGRTSDIASCNYVARSFGLKNGMWLGLAKNVSKLDNTTL